MSNPGTELVPVNSLVTTVSEGAESTDVEFEDLLDYLKRSRGFDFTGYKRASLRRRLDKRIQQINIGSYDSYTDYLEVHPDEFGLLFNTVLINVTTFFRDTSSWEYISEEIIPRILAAKAPGEPIRLWSAGCASGQEPYTLAIALAEKLGFDAFRDRVKIYATDIDEEALVQARAASYSAREVQGIPPEVLAKYFDKEGGWYVFNKDLRRCLIFGRHDLLHDAPISRIDLLVCRNTVMYFNAEVQAGILSRFHFAIRDGGFLFLGKAEMIFAHTGLFLPLDLRRRVFVKVAKPSLRDQLLLMAQSGIETAALPIDNPLRLWEAAFQNAPTAQIVLDLNGLLTMANERARILFHLSNRDIGRPLQDLELSYRPIELRSRVEQAQTERRTISVKDVPWTGGGSKTIFLEALIVPLQENGILLGVSVSFSDITRYRQLSEELQAANHEMESAYAEMQSANEELETTNEELQSTVEELETTNEELQSINEELETTSEEVQSINEELRTVNTELQQRSEELNQVNAFMESILTSLRGGVIVLDADLLIQIWNIQSQELWGLRPEEVQGKQFLSLDIGLPVVDLIHAVRACLTGGSTHQEIMLEARNRRGKTITCKVTITPLLGTKNAICGVILLMEQQQTSPLSPEAA
ncbi:MAG: CheR family methyltransferase [Janthinobacterium lividum]